MKQKKIGLVLLEIFGLLLAILWLSPFYLMLVNAFKTKREIFTNVLGIPEEFTFENFNRAFVELDFVNSFLNSLFISVVSVAIIILFSAMAGYALARNKSKLSNIIFYFFVGAMLIPFQSVMIPLVSIFGQAEMLNQASLIFMYLGFGCSLSIFLYHGAMTGISNSLDEAAKIDGANKFQTFWHIIFPLLKPISVTVGILNVIWIWNDFLLPSLVIGEANATIPLKMFYFFGQYTKQWHLALAGLTIAIIPVIIGYFFAQKQIIKGVSEGAVK
ncbi:maltose transport system permease protein [Cytobacillus horneckiae]|uniref:Carbohydrate ABC transporter permease n=1 Tax=Cytobacillus horneckiae TaxID=549687 RepID=A0A2N0ZAC0_9BACI|nr:carbohydrate ABC transporter permease [Cytobacillus horneckiae]MBN6889376.1 carbohydrate ABC transporter permease [Cytobacillus horneckiae]MCM3179507.1 carbohydrate ABC transporter permease [Cytobacillus horneckiae]MEC1154931.1 carbohydrate ABC transporter permease [Cytobacillus horneckiae]MED2936163.1 carbohydrate ABC transporter permease [Cytobacillus horneckiae]PKG26453.1 carbohydrate ABC transporter permease [Cytobacillus horneckiae]